MIVLRPFAWDARHDVEMEELAQGHRRLPLVFGLEVRVGDVPAVPNHDDCLSPQGGVIEDIAGSFARALVQRLFGLLRVVLRHDRIVDDRLAPAQRRRRRGRHSERRDGEEEGGRLAFLEERLRRLVAEIVVAQSFRPLLADLAEPPCVRCLRIRENHDARRRRRGRDRPRSQHDARNCGAENHGAKHGPSPLSIRNRGEPSRGRPPPEGRPTKT